MSVRLGNVDQLSALFADSFRMAVRRATTSPPHTNAMMTIMVIQVAVVMRVVPFDWAVGLWADAPEEGPTRAPGGERPFRGRTQGAGRGAGGQGGVPCRGGRDDPALMRRATL